MNNNRRTNLKFAVALGSVLIVAVVATCLFVGKMHERKEFVATVDPASGVRCRFTVASDWIITRERFDPPKSKMEYDCFTAPPPSPIWQRINGDLLHRPPLWPTKLLLKRWTAKSNSSGFYMEDGYPKPALGKGARILGHRHLRIGGLPATIIRVQGGAMVYAIFMLVSIPGGSYLSIRGFGDGNPDLDKMEREIQAIISSFRVEKVGTR